MIKRFEIEMQLHIAFMECAIGNMARTEQTTKGNRINLFIYFLFFFSLPLIGSIRVGRCKEIENVVFMLHNTNICVSLHHAILQLA